MDEYEYMIVHQGPGYIIANATTAQTLIPYSASHGGVGGPNHGFIDLRGSPGRVSSVPEAQKSAGLAEILAAVARPDSHLMTSSCECVLFDLGSQTKYPQYRVGGYVDLMFQEADRNRSPNTLEDLAVYILAGITESNDHRIRYEMVIEPIRAFFGRSGCHALLCKPYGYGDTETQAWSAFNHAAHSVALSLGRNKGAAFI